MRARSCAVKLTSPVLSNLYSLSLYTKGNLPASLSGIAAANGWTPTRSFARKRSKRPVRVPEFVTPRRLAKLLRVSIADLSSVGKSMYPWWPHDTRRTLRRSGYTAVDEVALHFDEIRAIAESFDKTVELEDVEDLEAQLSELPKRERLKLARSASAVASAVDVAPSAPSTYDRSGKGQQYSSHFSGGVSKIVEKTPVVAVMGHVDHGKTTIMERFVGCPIAGSEAGGITQEIYCFSVPLRFPDGKDRHVTFLDTPGHQEFVEMRTGGASFADLALLVVAANEGIQPQTRESLELIRAYNVPFILCINKVDTSDAQPQLVRRQFEELGFPLKDAMLVDPHHPFDAVPCVEISAKQGLNMDTLIRGVSEAIHNCPPLADVLDLPQGAVLESFGVKGRGNVIRGLLYSGSISTGDSFLCGISYGRVRALRSIDGVHPPQQTTTVFPGVPFEIEGTHKGEPLPGCSLQVLPESIGQKVAEKRSDEDIYYRQERINDGSTSEATQHGTEHLEPLDDGLTSGAGIDHNQKHPSSVYGAADGSPSSGVHSDYTFDNLGQSKNASIGLSDAELGFGETAASPSAFEPQGYDYDDLMGGIDTQVSSKHSDDLEGDLDHFAIDGEDQDEDDVVEIPVLIKADTTGSLLTLLGFVSKVQEINGIRVHINVLDSSVGAVSTKDVTMLSAIPDSSLLVFRAPVEKRLAVRAKQNSVHVYQFDVFHGFIDMLSKSHPDLQGHDDAQ